jgi:hypothetical protein
MLDTIRRPLLSGERMQESGGGTAEKIIKPNDRLTSFERLEIYNQQYWWRLNSIFGEDYPGVRAVIGTRAFDRLTTAYLEACPSRSWSLRNLGARLPQFLAEHPDATAPHSALAYDVAQVEWAATAAFDDPESERIDPQQFATADATTLRLALQPYLHLLELRYPVDRLLTRLRKRKDDAAAASNAVGVRRKTRAVRITSRALPETLHLAVHRVDYGVYYKRLDPLAYHLLRALRAGATLESACEIALAGSPLSPEEATVKVREWFTTFTALGWLCPRKGQKPVSRKQ